MIMTTLCKIIHKNILNNGSDLFNAGNMLCNRIPIKKNTRQYKIPYCIDPPILINRTISRRAKSFSPASKCILGSSDLFPGT